jgi:hypothetical protein
LKGVNTTTAINTGFSDSTIDKTVDGITYDVYTHGDANTGANVELWVQQEVVLFYLIFKLPSGANC